MNNQNNDILNRYFGKLKEQSYDDTYSSAQEWVRNEAARINSERSSASQSGFFKRFFTKKVRFGFALCMIILIIAAFTIPVSQNKTIGYVLTWTVENATADVLDRIKELTWIDKSQLSVKVNFKNGKLSLTFSLISPETTQDKFEEYSQDIKNITSISDIGITPLVEEVKRPVYSAALNKFFNIDVSTESKDAETVKRIIDQQLRPIGISGDFNIDLVKSAGGSKNFDFNFRSIDDSNRVVLKLVNEELERALHDIHVNVEPLIVKVTTDTLLQRMVIRKGRKLDSLHIKIYSDIVKNIDMSGLYEKMDSLQKKINIDLEKNKIIIRKLDALDSIDLNLNIDKMIDMNLNVIMDNVKMKIDSVNKKINIKIKRHERDLERLEKLDEEIENELKDLDELNVKIDKDVQKQIELNMEKLKGLDSLKFNFDNGRFDEKELQKVIEKTNEVLKKIKIKQGKDSTDLNIEIDFNDEDINKENKENKEKELIEENKEKEQEKEENQ